MSLAEDDYYWGENFNKKRTSKRKQMAPPGVHVPNKNEAKILRKIMSETGLSEEEVRSHKKYRIELSKAQKKKGDKSREERRLLSILKSITRELKLPKEHPLVKEEYLKRIKTDGYYSFLSLYNPLIVFDKK